MSRAHRRKPMSDERARMLLLAQRLYTGGSLTSAMIMEVFGVSPATAKRDLVVLEATLPVKVDLGRELWPGGPAKKTLSLHPAAHWALASQVTWPSLSIG